MSSTTPAPVPGGLTEDQKVIIAVVCSVVGLATIALLLRFLVPCCRKKKYKNQPDDRSLFQSTQSLSNGEHQFFYSGPALPPRDAKSDRSHSDQPLPLPHGPARKHTYVNTATAEFRESSAWVSGFDLSRSNSREDGTRQPDIVHTAPSEHDEEIVEMREEYARQDSADLHRYPRPEDTVAYRFPGYATRQDITREGSPRMLRAERNVRTSRIDRISEESSRTNEYDMPPRFPREVEGTQPQIVSREPLLKSPVTTRRPAHYVRSMNSESGVKRSSQEVDAQPSWIGHALMMQNPGLIPRSLVPPVGSTAAPTLPAQSARNARSAPEELSAEQILRSTRYTEGAPAQVPDSLEWKELKKYGHFAQPGPGTRTIYSLGKDAVRTSELRDYVRSGPPRKDTRPQRATYRNDASATSSSYRGDNASYYASRGRDYAHTAGQSGGGFLPIDSDSIPTYLPPESDRQRRDTLETNRRLNRELSSYLSNGSSLKALDMSSQYRHNWDNQFDPHHQHETSLNHYTHPSENRSLVGAEMPGWNHAQQAEEREEILRQQQINQNLFKPIKGNKGKKGKGKK